MRTQKSPFLTAEVRQNLLSFKAPLVKGLDIASHSVYCDETRFFFPHGGGLPPGLVKEKVYSECE